MGNTLILTFTFAEEEGVITLHQGSASILTGGTPIVVSPEFRLLGAVLKPAEEFALRALDWMKSDASDWAVCQLEMEPEEKSGYVYAWMGDHLMPWLHTAKTASLIDAWRTRAPSHSGVTTTMESPSNVERRRRCNSYVCEPLGEGEVLAVLADPQFVCCPTCGVSSSSS
jgi:hypothetical protein